MSRQLATLGGAVDTPVTPASIACGTIEVGDKFRDSQALKVKVERVFLAQGRRCRLDKRVSGGLGKLIRCRGAIIVDGVKGATGCQARVRAYKGRSTKEWNVTEAVLNHVQCTGQSGDKRKRPCRRSVEAEATKLINANQKITSPALVKTLKATAGVEISERTARRVRSDVLGKDQRATAAHNQLLDSYLSSIERDNGNIVEYEAEPNGCPDRLEDGNDKVGMDLRWHGHALHAQTLVLTQQCNDSMERLEGMDDREARGVLKGLVEEYRAVNDSLATLLAGMSNANQGLVEMVQNSKGGRSSLMVRRAAEMLVKVRSSLCAPAALANAEKEVQSLKAELKEVEGQRDRYKTLLAKTNSELGLARAYAQMSRATRQDAARAIDAKIRVGKASPGESSSPAVEALVKRSRGSDKGKAPARRQWSSRENDVVSSSLDTVANVRDLLNAGTGNRAEDGAKSRQESILGLEEHPKRSVLVSPARIMPGTAMWGTNGSKALVVGTGARGSGKMQSKLAVAVAASSKRARTLGVSTRLEDDEYCGRTTVKGEVSPHRLWGTNGSKALAVGMGARGSGKMQSKSAVAVAASSSSKRARTLGVGIRLEDDEYCGRTTVKGEVSPLRLRGREGVTRKKLGDGVDVTDWVEEGVGDGEELSKGDVGSSSSAAQDKRGDEDQSANDSDEAPSMFFACSAAPSARSLSRFVS